MKSDQVRHVRRAAVAAGVGGLLVVGVLVFVPDEKKDAAAPPAPGPEGRALAAVTAGAPATRADLSALIRDREARVRAHPDDAKAWAVLGSAYVARGVQQADPSSYPLAERALDRALYGSAGGDGATPGAGTGSAGAVSPGTGSAPPAPSAP
ncbi:hypothetical protein JFN87_24785, partial [Streptomyces bomunensis]|nr:hypothetical protein [Streptomyces montanisoli]